MKNRNKIYRLFLIIMIFALKCQTSYAQLNIPKEKAKGLKEQVFVITDRETYCADEAILFSAFNVSESKLKQANWSNVIYLELVSPDGEVIVKNKYPFTETANGELEIPTWILTGNYYLRAYTRWMRNFEQGINFYKMIRIINPFRSEILEPNNEQQITKKTTFKSIPNEKDISLKLNKTYFSKREKVTVDLSIGEGSNLFPQGTIAVVRKGSEQKIETSISLNDSSVFLAGFIPETRGVSVSGKVINKIDSTPLPYTLVGLTIFKDNPENLNVLSDENGMFFFDLSNLNGEYELFISAKPTQKDQQPTILVDNDFFSKTFHLPFVSMDFSEENIKLFQQMSFTSQMAALYQKQKKENKKTSFQNDSLFYGTPDFTLDFNQYIALPSISEYFHELVPRVRVIKKEKQVKLKVVGLDPELDIYDPLILIDMVSIFDVEKILALDPQKLKKIEVVTKPYVRGDITYGGIISFYSRKGDLAGIDLPSTGRFISYKMLDENDHKINPQLPAKQIPVIGNCIYWNPSVHLSSNTQTITFNTGDNIGDFLIMVRVIDEDGNLKEVQKLIQIK